MILGEIYQFSPEAPKWDLIFEETILVMQLDWCSLLNDTNRWDARRDNVQQERKQQKHLAFDNINNNNNNNNDNGNDNH